MNNSARTRQRTPGWVIRWASHGERLPGDEIIAILPSRTPVKRIVELVEFLYASYEYSVCEKVDRMRRQDHAYTAEEYDLYGVRLSRTDAKKLFELARRGYGGLTREENEEDAALLKRLGT